MHRYLYRVVYEPLKCKVSHPGRDFLLFIALPFVLAFVITLPAAILVLSSN